LERSFRRRICSRARRPTLIPRIKDSNGNPGILADGVVVILSVVVVVIVFVDVDEVDVTTYVVELETVDTITEVEVDSAAPVKGTNHRIVESTCGGMIGGKNGDPTIQPLVGDVMNTEFRFGGITGSPSKEGARVICVQATPSQ
jgi:hypothetical protein